MKFPYRILAAVLVLVLVTHPVGAQSEGTGKSGTFLDTNSQWIWETWFSTENKGFWTLSIEEKTRDKTLRLVSQIVVRSIGHVEIEIILRDRTLIQIMSGGGRVRFFIFKPSYFSWSFPDF